MEGDFPGMKDLNHLSRDFKNSSILEAVSLEESLDTPYYEQSIFSQ